MNKRQLAILERAWAEEIDTTSIGLIQTKSKVAAQLAWDGYLKRETIFLDGNITVTGFRITHAGIFEYCQSIPDDFDIEAAEAEIFAEPARKGGGEMIYRRGWVPVLWGFELEKRLREAGFENWREIAEFLRGRDDHDGDPCGFDYQVVDNTEWMARRDATFWQRLNRLWFVPLLLLSVPFQWLFRGRVGCETTSKFGMLCQKITGLK